MLIGDRVINEWKNTDGMIVIQLGSAQTSMLSRFST